MAVSVTYEGQGLLQLQQQEALVSYKLVILQDLRGVFGYGFVAGRVSFIQQAEVCGGRLLVASGQHWVDIVITRHTHGLPAEFKAQGQIPSALHP